MGDCQWYQQILVTACRKVLQYVMTHTGLFYLCQGEGKRLLSAGLQDVPLEEGQMYERKTQVCLL